MATLCPPPRIDLSLNSRLDPVARALLTNLSLTLITVLSFFVTYALKKRAVFVIVMLCVIVKSDYGEAGKASGRLTRR
jgi:hypothetical protein